MKKKNRGFSLVELIVVVAIMAVLVGVLAPSLLRYVEKTRIQKDVSAVSEVREAVIVAMGDEDIFSKTPSGSTVEIKDGTAIAVTAGTGTGADADALKAELATVIGSTGVDLSSNDLKDCTITLTITVSNTNVTCDCTSITGGDGLDDYTESSLKALGYTAPAGDGE